MGSMQQILKVVAIGVVIAIALFFLGYPKTYPKSYGITWSTPYATYLGIDSTLGLTAALDELQVKHVRLMTYWTEGEKTPGHTDWSEVDQQLDLVQSRGATVTLVIGAKQPRWPECWIPDWAKKLSLADRRQAQLDYVKKTIEHFKSREVITRWQVENEPKFFSSFGDCGYYDPSTLTDEIALVTSLDQLHRPISTTASGELSTWLTEPKKIDLGFSVYRTVPTTLLGPVHYWFLTSWFYNHKIYFRSLIRDGSMYVSEFQMEPWVTNGILTTSFEEQAKTFDLNRMKDDVIFINHLNVPTVDLWGAEWWYWMKTKKDHPEFWEEAKNIFK